MVSVNRLICSDDAESGQSGELMSMLAVVLRAVSFSWTGVAITSGSAIAEIGETCSFESLSLLANGDRRLPPPFSGRMVGVGPVRSMVTGAVAVVAELLLCWRDSWEVG